MTVPAPMIAVSPTRPGSFMDMPPVEVAAATLGERPLYCVPIRIRDRTFATIAYRSARSAEW